MRLEDLTGLHVVLLGFGIDNEAVLPEVLRARAASVCIALDDPTSLSAERRAVVGDAGLEIVATSELPSGTEVIVRSPGYPRYRSALLAAEGAGAAVTTPTDLWLARHAAGHTFVAVTGTKGKSSTTVATAALLRAAGRGTVVAGNIGVPVWSVHPEPDDVLVVEVSSYQAVDIRTRPHVGVLTSLSSDHLSWHGGQEQYERDKLSLFGAPGEVPTLLVAAGERGALAATAHLHPTVVDPDDAAFDVLREVAATRHLAGPLVANLALACGAAGAVLGAPLREDQVRAGIEGFEPLQSRHQTVAVRAGLRFVDDALATNPNAAAVSLETYRGTPVALIVGGEDRGVALAPLQAAVATHAAPLVLVTVPDTGAAMAASLVPHAADESAVEVHAAADVTEAVDLAASALRARIGSTGTGVVLFAPAAPTPGHLGTWKDRSAAFQGQADRTAG